MGSLIIFILSGLFLFYLSVDSAEYGEKSIVNELTTLLRNQYKKQKEDTPSIESVYSPNILVPGAKATTRKAAAKKKAQKTKKATKTKSTRKGTRSLE
jgi:hypothetical protein